MPREGSHELVQPRREVVNCRLRVTSILRIADLARKMTVGKKKIRDDELLFFFLDESKREKSIRLEAKCHQLM